ncbi:hypothetical protein H9Q74_005022 [Fusarium xylarioides]|nr:hypothetical protein H9Q71_004838 [Fusarium xylarioides]KAG5824888.1 hypothetical protein H9Q74_005022 [Fusarium xylarioides]
MAPAYASEIRPMALRGYLANYVCLCWALIQLLAAGVLFSFSDHATQWACRLPFAIQWIWHIPLIIILWFTPESLYWLVKKSRLDDTKAVLRRISAKSNKTAARKVADTQVNAYADGSEGRIIKETDF